jgi:hypothetical protein
MRVRSETQVFAVVDQQAQLALGPVQAGARQIRLPERRPGDRQGIDGIGLAEGASGVPGVCHQLGWHAHNPLRGAQEVTLQAAGEMAAVLDRPQPRVSLGGRPGDESEVLA